MAGQPVKCLAIAFLAAPLGACALDVERSNLGGPRADAAQSPISDARYDRSVEGRTVIAESRYGHGSSQGPVRRNSYGRLEVRAPGGTWFECARSCTETLRKETVDFWESRGGRNDPPDGPGYLRWSR